MRTPARDERHRSTNYALPSLELTATAARNIDRLIETHELPEDTLDRILGSLEPLTRFPLAGRALRGSWEGLRLVIGPWSWMLLIYVFDEASDRVLVITVQDGRRASSATTQGA